MPGDEAAALGLGDGGGWKGSEVQEEKAGWHERAAVCSLGAKGDPSWRGPRWKPGHAAGDWGRGQGLAGPRLGLVLLLCCVVGGAACEQCPGTWLRGWPALCGGSSLAPPHGF